VSRFGFGGCPLGGHGWGDTDERRLTAAIDAAFDAGVTFFDTADIYGLGRSEELLGDALQERRGEVTFATKFGVRRENDVTVYDNSSAWMRTSAEGSLKRLKTDRIDLYQLHYWDQQTPLADIVGGLQGLRDEGKIRAFGVTNLNPSEISRDPVEGLVSFSMEYNLTRQDRTEEIRRSEAGGLTFLSWGSLAQGALSGKYAAGATFDPADRRSRGAYSAFHGEGVARREHAVSRLRAIAPNYPGRTLAQLAVRWILDSHPASVALVGMKSPGQVVDMSSAFDWSLSEEDLAFLSMKGGSSAENGLVGDV
tara:strand:+ start:51652 stop:52578 length:927 start_codon:yes stop_codon:yes gene_type:complete